MKTLQNNFTTPEQSKRLLELGVPADSADCYWNDISLKPIPMQEGILYSDKRNQFTKVNVPVWSVGRLMEIIAECYQVDMPFRYFVRGGMTESLINTFIELREEIDFSKLEE